MATFTFRCGWCGSKDQTADVVSHYIHRFRSHGVNDRTDYRFAVHCRKCRNFSQITASKQYPVPDRFNKYDHAHSSDFDSKLFADAGDITGAFSSDFRQVPGVSLEISAEIPASVRECLLDAAEARSPRAKCQSYRTALEFALREAAVTSAPGKTLGGILAEAKKNYALPDALIELCDQVKAFGNWGLHWAETEIVDNDAVAAKTIAKAVLDYLFVLPAEVLKAKARTDQAKGNHAAGATKGAKP